MTKPSEWAMGGWVRSFHHAKGRCTNERNRNYKNYGGRGIRFLLTKKQMESIWLRDKGYLLEQPSIDRIDVNKNYHISNCRFIEKVENSRGKKHKRTMCKKEIHPLVGSNLKTDKNGYSYCVTCRRSRNKMYMRVWSKRNLKGQDK